jgi:Ca2+-binding EF-hand superfamily protein
LKELKMNKISLRIIGAVALSTGLAAAGPLVAQDSGQGGDASEQRENRAEKMFARFDTDQDGRITLEEFEASRKDRFANADQNSDGSISRDELIAAIVARASDRAETVAERMFSRLDADDDGLISADEIPADRAATLFARLDANGDGSIVLAEIGELRRGRGGFGKPKGE